MTEVDTGKSFTCNPNEEFIAPIGKYKAWNEARLINEDGTTAYILKAGQVINNEPATKPTPKKVKLIEEDDD